MEKMLTAAIAGLGNRGLDTYAAEMAKYPGEVKIVAVADLKPEKVDKARKLFGIRQENCFGSAEEMLEQDKLADFMIIATPDRLHIPQAMSALQKGYDLLLEKPISSDAGACKQIAVLAEKLDRKVVVCHVLRYTPFYKTLKQMIEQGKIGEVVSIMAIENVGYYHHAHSFVRGNWRNSRESSPMILQKCCHDTDILTWLAGGTAKTTSSFGSTYLFKSEKAPQNQVKRCLDGCPVKEQCVFDAEKIYITNDRTGVAKGNTGWPNTVLTLTPTVESVYQALKEGPYGRCVYYCDNDVVDHQIVNINMENGATISLTMSGLTGEFARYLKIMGTAGELIGDMATNLISYWPFGSERQVINVAELADNFEGHGGGDAGLIREFLDYMQGKEVSAAITSLEVSTDSHYIALAAEESRLAEGKAVSIDSYR
ncbi:gfo/Idh/MocA family oxidoreductase [Clostridiales bacterium COT073_COT-073]|nr:gfo/Idh/MocA family oxidoreductase [Clostridiales bacterium COT073_COT-073]